MRKFDVKLVPGVELLYIAEVTLKPKFRTPVYLTLRDAEWDVFVFADCNFVILMCVFVIPDTCDLGCLASHGSNISSAPVDLTI